MIAIVEKSVKALQRACPLINERFGNKFELVKCLWRRPCHLLEEDSGAKASSSGTIYLRPIVRNVLGKLAGNRNYAVDHINYVNQVFPGFSTPHNKLLK